MWYFILDKFDNNDASVALSWVWGGNPFRKVAIYYAVRRLTAESRKVSKLRDLVL